MAEQSGSRRCRGFSLLEVLVAFTILALSLGVLMQIFAGSLRNLTVTDGYAQAADLADARLALVGAEIPAQPGTHGGEEGRFQWRLTLSPMQLAEFAQIPNGVALLHVAVQVQWGEGEQQRVLALESLRVQAIQQGG